MVEKYPFDDKTRPSLQEQLEDLFGTVWKCERWERKHPFTVAVIRNLVSKAPLKAHIPLRPADA
jgi:hypothetical protein